jgi:hypothetical protein
MRVNLRPVQVWSNYWLDRPGGEGRFGKVGGGPMIEINCLRSTRSFAPPGGQPGRSAAMLPRKSLV